MSSASKSEGDDSSISVRQKALLSKGSRSAQHWNISMSHSLMMSSLLSPSCARMDSLNKKKKKCFGYKRLFISSSSGLMLQKKQKTNQNKQRKKKKTTTISTWHIQLTSKSLTAFESATSAWGNRVCAPLTGSSLLGIDKDDERQEEDEKGVSLLEVQVPHSLCNIRKAVAGKETAQLWTKYKHSGQSRLVITSLRQKVNT